LIPTSASALFSGPMSAARIQAQSTDVATIGVSDGMKNIVR
jgi:hypothetical protein